MSRRNSSLLGSVCWQYLWNPWETVLEHYVERCLTVISERYSDILRHNRLANQRKRDGFLLVRGVILEHDNKHLHSAVKSIGTLQDPSYRTDPTDRIAPSLLALRPPFCEALRRRQLSSERRTKSDEGYGASVAYLIAQILIFCTHMESSASLK